MNSALQEKELNMPVSAGEEDVRQYLREIRSYPLLSPEAERSLARRCAVGDEEAIRLMVSSNLRLVVSVAREYAGQNIRINCLRYGWVQGQSLCADALENVALARVAHPRELARAARFFLGEGSSFMTGQTIDVNGGRLY